MKRNFTKNRRKRPRHIIIKAFFKRFLGKLHRKPIDPLDLIELDSMITDDDERSFLDRATINVCSRRVKRD